MSEDQSSVVTLKVRVTPEFREKIVETAKANNRSMNQEIVDRLESSFSANFFRVTTFNDLNEIGYTIEIDRFTFGLFKSQLHEIKLYEMHFNYWILSYQSLRCTINSSIANELIELGCKFDGSNIR